jgi:hypothetical protein
MRSNPIHALLVAAVLGTSFGMVACTANIDDVNLTVTDPEVSFDTDIDVTV